MYSSDFSVSFSLVEISFLNYFKKHVIQVEKMNEFIKYYNQTYLCEKIVYINEWFLSNPVFKFYDQSR